MYVPKRLPLSESLISTRVVTKFSLTACWPGKVNTPISPLPSMDPSRRCQKVKYACALGSTVTAVGVQGLLGSPSGIEHNCPLRAAWDGTVVNEVMPFDCRMPS